MYIKNALRLLINNLYLAFRAVLFRLIVTIIGLSAAYGIAYAGMSVIFKSSELAAFIVDIKGLWNQFLGINFNSTIDIESTVKPLITLFQDNIGRFVWSFIALILVFFAMNYVLGLCNFALGVMIDRHMSSISKTRFIPTFLEILKKASSFELFYAVIKTIYYSFTTAVLILIIIVCGNGIGMMSILLGLWVVIALLALFYSFTARLRPMIIRGEKLGYALKHLGIDKKQFPSVFASFAISVVMIAYFNITMFISTFGAGIMISLPLTYIFWLCLQQVIDYTLLNKKYYIDFDTIVTPKVFNVEEEKMLNEVDIK